MQRSHYIGISLMLVSSFCYSLIATIVKSLDHSISIPTIVWAQSIVSLLLSLPIMLHGGLKKFKQRLNSNNKKWHLLRASFSLGISCFIFLAVNHMTLVDVMLLANTSPFMVPLIGALFMHHSLNNRIWLPLLLGFVGVIFVLQPDKGVFQVAAFYALAAALCMASSTLIIRRTSQQDSALTINFYYCVFAVLLSSMLAIFFWQPLSLQQCSILIAIGSLFFMCQYTLAWALTNISAQLASSLYYSNIVFAAVFSWIFWKTVLDFNVLMGIVFIFVGGIFCIHLQYQHEKNAARIKSA